MQKIITTIRRRELILIAKGRQKYESRNIKPYWTKRLESIKPPFILVLINGRSWQAPRISCEIRKVTIYDGLYRMHIKNVFNIENCKEIL